MDNEWTVLTTRANKVLLVDAEPKFWQLWVRFPNYVLYYNDEPFTDFHASLRAMDSRVFTARAWEDKFAHCRRMLECIECEIALRVLDRDLDALRARKNEKKQRRLLIERRLQELRSL